MARRDGAIDMVATRAIDAGEDLLLCYGKLDNSMLLLDYGEHFPCLHAWSCRCSSSLGHFGAVGACLECGVLNRIEEKAEAPDKAGGCWRAAPLPRPHSDGREMLVCAVARLHRAWQPLRHSACAL